MRQLLEDRQRVVAERDKVRVIAILNLSGGTVQTFSALSTFPQSIRFPAFFSRSKRTDRDEIRATALPPTSLLRWPVIGQKRNNGP